MKTCFLFGHADCPEDMLPKIEDAIENCYTKGVTDFYVGNRGNFDRLAATAVKNVKGRHSDVRLYLLLAYHPAERPVALWDGCDGSYYPPLENVPRPFAIVRANRYMVDHSDALICYVRHIGNTKNLLEYAQKRKKAGGCIFNVAVEKDICGYACRKE